MSTPKSSSGLRHRALRTHILAALGVAGTATACTEIPTPGEPKAQGLYDAIDKDAETARLTKELARLDKIIAGTQGRLANKAFLDKAPTNVIEGAKQQLDDLRKDREETQKLLDALNQ